MTCLRYKVLSPIRLLLPISAGLFALPFIFEKDLLVYTTLPLFYFLGIYFFLLNFPGLAESMHKRPLYIEDLEIARIGVDTPDRRFQHVYSIIMNFLLAAVFAGLAEYMILNNVREKTIVEALGVIGGNLGLYYKIQSNLGRVMIGICHKYKLRSLNQLEDNIEGMELPENIP